MLTALKRLPRRSPRPLNVPLVVVIGTAVVLSPAFLVGSFRSIPSGIWTGAIFGGLVVGFLLFWNVSLGKNGYNVAPHWVAVPIWLAFPLAGFCGGALRALFVS